MKLQIFDKTKKNYVEVWARVRELNLIKNGNYEVLGAAPSNVPGSAHRFVFLGCWDLLSF